MTYITPYKNRVNAIEWPNAFGGLDKQLDSFFANFPSLFDLSENFAAPATSARFRWYENDTAYLLRLDLPGLAKGDIDVELDGDALKISAKSGKQSAGEGESASERVVFRQSVTVPEGVEQNEVAAKYEEGVLSVTLPKVAKRKPQQISVSFK